MARGALTARDVGHPRRRRRAVGAEILDAPADYGGQPGYAAGYYAAFFADPDGLKLEGVHLPAANP